MTDQQKQAVAFAATDYCTKFKMDENSTMSLIQDFRNIGEHIITNPSDFGLPDPKTHVSIEEMFGFAEWLGKNYIWHQPAMRFAEMDYFTSKANENHLHTTAQLFEIYKNSKK